MRKKIKRCKYSFLLEYVKKKNLYGFYIKAISKNGKRYSYINNLNCVLSIFNIGIEDNKVAESQWIVKEKEGKLYFNKMTTALSDNTFRKFLENQLDIDRRLGEWNKL